MKLFFVSPSLHNFSQEERKVNVVSHPDNFTKTYQVKKSWQFDARQSGALLNQTITTLNVPLLFAKSSREGQENGLMDFFFESMLSSINAQVFVNKTAQELLFDGYEDELLSIASMVGAAEGDGKFGWFYGVSQLFQSCYLGLLHRGQKL